MRRHVMPPCLAIILAPLVFAVHTALAQVAAPQVQLDGAHYTGIAGPRQGEAVFKGVPFAAPPVGVLRWRPPEPLSPSGTPRAATVVGPSCPQAPVLISFRRGIAAAFGTADKVDTTVVPTSEDCLSLNIWTAHWNDRRTLRPVMVWFHGGSNMFGEGSSAEYDGAALARRGVVLVTINYRLGALGFLSHPALTAESPDKASGNYGLLDQVAALQWVKRNIRAVGGDPGRVTIFGESAGSIDVLALMASPLSTGLFHRAIAESGTPMGASQSLVQAEAAGVALARSLGIDSTADVLASLRRASAQDIIAAAGRLVLAGQYTPGPIVDGWVLPERPGKVFDDGRQNAVPLLIGSNGLEMSTLRTYLPRIPRTTDAYAQWVRATLGMAAPRLLALYPPATDAGVDDALVRLTTDLFITCPSRYVARAVARAGQPAYLYLFTRVLPGGAKLGAYHSAEIGYVFGNRTSWLPNDAVDDSLAATIGDYWVRFATTGNPNMAGRPEWPTHDVVSDRSMELGDRVASQSGVRREACDLVALGLRMQHR